MNNKLEVLKRVTGDDFVAIDAQNFKSKEGDVVYLETYDDVVTYILKNIKEELPYLSNDLLRLHLPKGVFRYESDFMLDELKEFAKADHRFLSEAIKDMKMLAYDVMNYVNQDDSTLSVADLVLIDSEVYREGQSWIFYLKHEIN